MAYMYSNENFPLPVVSELRRLGFPNTIKFTMKSMKYMKILDVFVVMPNHVHGIIIINKILRLYCAL